MISVLIATFLGDPPWGGGFVRSLTTRRRWPAQPFWHGAACDEGRTVADNEATLCQGQTRCVAACHIKEHEP